MELDWQYYTYSNKLVLLDWSTTFRIYNILDLSKGPQEVLLNVRTVIANHFVSFPPLLRLDLSMKVAKHLPHCTRTINSTHNNSLPGPGPHMLTTQL